MITVCAIILINLPVPYFLFFLSQELLESYLIDFAALEPKISLTRNQIQNAEELVSRPAVHCPYNTVFLFFVFYYLLVLSGFAILSLCYNFQFPLVYFFFVNMRKHFAPRWQKKSTPHGII